MARSGFLRHAAAIILIPALLLAAWSSPALASELSPAAKMSEALGGSLADGMIAADFSGHGKLDTTVTLKSGRGDEYRRRVARVLAAQSHFATSAH